MAQVVEKPVILVFADPSRSDEMTQLFGRRGFIVQVVSSVRALELYIVSHGPDHAAVLLIDFRHPKSASALSVFADLAVRPAVVAIVQDVNEVDPDLADEIVTCPVDPARLFVRVVELAAHRRKGRYSKKLTGVVGIVRGNALFQCTLSALHTAVSPVNAGAVLESLLRQLGASPASVERRHVDAIVASGHLAEALSRFGEPSQIDRAVKQLIALPR
jgi:hypothetical protein